MNASALAANVKLVWLSFLPGLPHWAGARAEERQLRPGVLMGPSTSLATVLRMERNWMLCWVRGGAKEWARARMICTRLSALHLLALVLRLHGLVAAGLPPV